MNCTAIIVAGGMGSRLGRSIPKAFVPLGGKELFRYSLEIFDASNLFSEIIIVVPVEAVEESNALIRRLNCTTPTVAIGGGVERWNSVKNGVDRASTDLVLIHDAARPFVTESIIKELLRDLGNDAGIITANPVVDTVRTFDGDYCGTTVDRSTLIAVGTPQLFVASKLHECYEKAHTLSVLPTDEAMLLEAFGEKVKFSYGAPKNFKVTTPSDFEIAEALVTQSEAL